MSCTFRGRWLTALIVVFALAAPFAAAADNDAKVFRAGAYAMDISPTKFPISSNGGMRDRQTTKVHDPLHARCLVLDDGSTKVAIVVCDSCMIPRDMYDAAKAIIAKKVGIRTDHMLMSATHTHTAPTSTGVFQSDPNQAYRKFLVQRIADGVAKAASHLEPARIGWAIGLDPTQVFNRRWLMRPGKFSPDPFGRTMDRAKMNPGFGRKDLLRPAGPTDPEVAIVSVQALDGRPIALLANYSLHYVGGVPGDSLSADYFAVFAHRIGELINADTEGKDGKPPFVGVMSNGTSGDINNINYSAERYDRHPPFEKMKLVADSVAQAAYAAYKRVDYHNWVPLKMAEAELTLGVRKPTADEVTRAKRALEEAYKQSPVLRSLAQVYARETVLIAEYPDTVDLKLQALRIGDLGICAIPCEVFVQIGLDIKKNSPLRPTFTIELANGYNGYLPTPQQHQLGGYETWRARSAYLETGASPKIYNTVMRLLKQVAPQGAQ